MNTAPESSRSLSRTQRYVLEQYLQGMLARLNGAEGAILASADGFPAAFHGELDETMQNRVAAVISSLCALGEAAGEQIDAGPLNVVSLQYDARQMQLISIRGQRSDYVLAVVARPDMLLGNSLWALRECAAQIIAALKP
jgi:predicted regulator of Ras-like GTPase activity (Roadblock/LC7/MglB family)